MAKKKSVNYIDNKKLIELIVEYKKSLIDAKYNDQSTPRMSEELGKAILDIANGMSHRFNFINYTFKDDMIGDAIENCILYITNFDPKKSNNAFAYVSQIIYYAFVRRIEKEKKQSYIKFKCIEQASSSGLYTEKIDGGNDDEYSGFLGQLQISKRDVDRLDEKTKKKSKTKQTKTSIFDELSE